MNKEQIEELKQIRKELEIPKESFLEMAGLSLYYKEFVNPTITDEDVFELVKESMNCYDFKLDNDSDRPPKTAQESFIIACNKMAFQDVYMGKTEDDEFDFIPTM